MALLAGVLETVDSHVYMMCFSLPFLLLVLRSFYRVLLHPLSHIPGPLLPSITSAWLNYHAYIGDEASSVHDLHKKYGPVVRIGPNDVDIADGAALNPIYVDKGGFRKPIYYRNFDIDGHASIFSATDPNHRASRAKAVLPLFSSANLRAGADRIYGCVNRFTAKVKEDSKHKAPVNILNLTRSFATDAVTAYLFQYSYGGLNEKSLSATGMVDSFVAGNRFFYLPGWLFSALESWLPIIGSDHEADASLSKVDRFVNDVVSATRNEDGSAKLKGNYPSRLMDQAEVTPHEAAAQCKDLIFAGTDSSGMNLATIMLHLSRSPSILKKLEDELCSERNRSVTDPLALQSLPYLLGVVREGLRISMANPARFGRVVPPGGWTFVPSGSSQHANTGAGNVFLPAGMTVSCTPFELHFNPNVFPAPLKFDPERWSEERETADMRRDFIPFGLGPRQCIARNLATVELFTASAALVRAGVLNGSRPYDEKLQTGDGQIPILQWFNSKVIGERIDLIWE